ncbi:chymotrypsin inhibitor-like isoform 1-T1 [Cochliomyia hominivorax]
MTKLFQVIFMAFLSAIIFEEFVTAQDLYSDYDYGSNKICGTNQEWTNCGTACPPKCGDTGPKYCTKQCFIGCRCKSGYLLNSFGECVTPKGCFK